MKKVLCLFFAVLIVILCSCSRKQPSGTENENQSPTAGDVKTEVAKTVRYMYFEDLMNYVTDLVEAKYLGAEATVDPSVFYLKFETVKNIRGNGVDETVYVQIHPSEYYVNEKNVSFSTSDFDKQYVPGLTYLLLLARWSSVYNDYDLFGLVTDSLVLPLDDLNNPDEQSHRLTLYGTDLSDHFREEETLSSFKNGNLENYILEKVKNNPLCKGYDYIKSTDPVEVIRQSEFIFKIKVDEKEIESFDGSRATYSCQVEEVLRGNAVSQWISITFLSGTVEIGKSYVVALNNTGGAAYYTLSSKQSLFNTSDIDWIRDLVS